MTTLWHGGAPGRKTGSLILPPSVTGFEETSGFISRSEGHEDISYRDDRVYITTDRRLATAFAAYWSSKVNQIGLGWLYAVQAAADDLEPDTDLLSSPGLSFQVPSALVTRVELRQIKWSEKHRSTLLRTLRQNEDARARKDDSL